MTERAKFLIAEARKLSVAERIEVAEAIVQSLGESGDDYDQAWVAEANDRLDAYRKGEIPARDFDEVLAKYTNR